MKTYFLKQWNLLFYHNFTCQNLYFHQYPFFNVMGGLFAALHFKTSNWKAQSDVLSTFCVNSGNDYLDMLWSPFICSSFILEWFSATPFWELVTWPLTSGLNGSVVWRLSLCIVTGTFSLFGIEITLGVDDLQNNKITQN